jgi:signal transduction histidine kinase
VSDRNRILIGRVMAAVAVSAALSGSLGMVLTGNASVAWEWYLVHNAMVAIGFSTIAWMVLPRQPRNRAVWIIAWAGFLPGLLPLGTMILVVSLESIGISAPVGEVAPSDLPLWLALVGQQFSWVWLGMLLLPTLLLLAFPDGRLPSPNWRWVAGAVLVLWTSAAVGLMWGAAPSSSLTYSEIQTLTWDSPEPSLWMFGVGYLGLILMIPVCVAAMIMRFRRSRGLQRQQFRWVAWGGAICVPFVVTGVVYEARGQLEVTLPLLVVAIVALMVPMGVSIGKYRLYDIDTVINRSVVFTVLVGFVAIIYGLLVVGLGSLIGGGGEGWTPILATAVVALAFEPVRHTGQRWANRLAYGHRATPYEVLADLTERLTAPDQEGDLLERMARLLVDGTGAERATVWLGDLHGMRPEASAGGQGESGEVDLADDTVFRVFHDGEVVGALEVVKPKGTALSTQERRLMADLAGSAGAVLGYRRLNESLALKAEEIERSRRRLVEAEDEERRRLEQELNEGAQQQILALKVNIGLAQRAAAEAGSEALVGLLGGLAEESQAALEEVRNLAKGIYPPVLESDGLGPAVSALAAGTPVEVEVSRAGIGRYPREVEAAVYFDISEALTNAVKHAEAPIRIELSEVDGVLRFSVSDSGPGFDPATTNRGSGLENLYDRVYAVDGRLEIISSPGSVTTVAGEIPLELATT